MIEAEYAVFFRWLPWRKRVEKREDDLRWEIYMRRFGRYTPPGVFVLVNKDFLK